MTGMTAPVSLPDWLWDLFAWGRLRWTRRGFSQARHAFVAFPGFGAPVHRRFSTCLLDPGGELLYEVVDAPVLLDQLRDFRGRMDDGRVITTTELLSDLR